MRKSTPRRAAPGAVEDALDDQVTLLVQSRDLLHRSAELLHRTRQDLAEVYRMLDCVNARMAATRLVLDSDRRGRRPR